MGQGFSGLQRGVATQPRHYRKSQLAYGEKIHNGRIVPHLDERMVITQFTEMRRQELPYADLATWPNKAAIPTKNRGRRGDGSGHFHRESPKD